MRKAVYLILLALLLLELVTVEGKCFGSRCSSMTLCADRCNKCTSSTSCKSAQRYCDRAKEVDVECKPSWSRTCSIKCNKCRALLKDSDISNNKDYPKCMSDAKKSTSCKGSCPPPTKPSSSSLALKCRSDCSKCTSTIKCNAVLRRCKKYGMTSCKPKWSRTCSIKCNKCRALLRDSDISNNKDYPKCMSAAKKSTSCKGSCPPPIKPKPSRLCVSKCNKCRGLLKDADTSNNKEYPKCMSDAKKYCKGSCPRAPPKKSPICYSKCNQCRALLKDADQSNNKLYPKCMRDATKYCKGSCPRPTSKGMADIFDMDWDETDEIVGVEPIESTSGLIAFKVTKPAIISVAVVIFLLVINISCLCYNKCIKNGKDKKIMYAKVAAIASSDDDMENLKRVQI